MADLPRYIVEIEGELYAGEGDPSAVMDAAASAHGGWYCTRDRCRILFGDERAVRERDGTYIEEVT